MPIRGYTQSTGQDDEAGVNTSKEKFKSSLSDVHRDAGQRSSRKFNPGRVFKRPTPEKRSC